MVEQKKVTPEVEQVVLDYQLVFDGLPNNLRGRLSKRRSWPLTC
jgi:hypothetical protein